eukprot:scaffold28650_cov56-Phaeocystis_antarctica.AAC.2
MNASGGMGGTVPSSLTNEPLPSSSLVSGVGAAAASSTAACPSGVRAKHSAASSAVAKVPSSPSCCRPRAASVPPPALAAAPPRSSAAAPLQLAPPPPAPPPFARRTAQLPRLWRSGLGSPTCHRASAPPCRAWACRAGGTRLSSPSRSWPRAASVPPPAPARSTLKIANAAR